MFYERERERDEDVVVFVWFCCYLFNNEELFVF